jgi:hypothetical protein
MKLGVFLMAGAMLLAGATASRAEVNCKFVMKNLSLPGRTVQSVAETMSISEDEVKKCQAEQAAGGGSGGGEKGTEKPAGEAK